MRLVLLDAGLQRIAVEDSAKITCLSEIVGRGPVELVIDDRFVILVSARSWGDVVEDPLPVPSQGLQPVDRESARARLYRTSSLPRRFLTVATAPTNGLSVTVPVLHASIASRICKTAPPAIQLQDSRGRQAFKGAKCRTCTRYPAPNSLQALRTAHIAAVQVILVGRCSGSPPTITSSSSSSQKKYRRKP